MTPLNDARDCETTTIYVQAEKKRAIEEIGKYFGDA
jgi:hypothetical protein